MTNSAREHGKHWLFRLVAVLYCRIRPAVTLSHPAAKRAGLRIGSSTLVLYMYMHVVLIAQSVYSVHTYFIASFSCPPPPPPPPPPSPLRVRWRGGCPLLLPGLLPGPAGLCPHTPAPRHHRSALARLLACIYACTHVFSRLLLGVTRATLK